MVTQVYTTGSELSNLETLPEIKFADQRHQNLEQILDNLAI